MQAQEAVAQANPRAMGARGDAGSEIKVAKSVSHASRKAAIVHMYPYRKPTQVDEERILRPAGEALSRNSAKWPRNFGRRGAQK